MEKAKLKIIKVPQTLRVRALNPHKDKFSLEVFSMIDTYLAYVDKLLWGFAKFEDMVKLENRLHEELQKRDKLILDKILELENEIKWLKKKKSK